MDYGKFLFEQNKKAHSAKRKQKQIQVKEVKFRPGTGESDYQIKLRNLTRFLSEGDKAKVTLRFRGREMVHQDIGRKLLDRVSSDLATHALHPARSARVLRRTEPVGWIGELHPNLVRSLDFTYAPVLFELDVEAALAVQRASYHEISRLPQIRRDLAIDIDEAITLSTLAERVTLAASSLLQDLRVFDVYRGPGLEPGRKSVALGLIFQDISRTLTNEDVDRLMASVVTDLRENLNARIRE